MAIKVVDKLNKSTNNLSVVSIILSSIIATVIGCSSPLVPAKVN